MQTTRNCPKSQLLPINERKGALKRKNRKTADAEPSTLQRHMKQAQELLGNLTVVIFTGSLFLGGSYLFFIKLAEFGW